MQRDTMDSVNTPIVILTIDANLDEQSSLMSFGIPFFDMRVPNGCLQKDSLWQNKIPILTVVLIFAFELQIYSPAL